MPRILAYTAIFLGLSGIVYAENVDKAEQKEPEQKEQNTTEISNHQSIETGESDKINYAKELDRLNKQLQLIVAENAISDQRLKAVEINKKINSANAGSLGETMTASHVPSHTEHAAISQTLAYAEVGYFALQRITGSLSNPTAWIAFNNSVAQVQTGDQLNNDWKVKSISPSTVVLENPTTHKTMQLYLAKANSNTQKQHRQY